LEDSKGQILTSKKLTDINSFENPNAVSIASFNGAKKEGDLLVIELPEQSVVQLELK
jgi:alpha-N-arabinofuranosidase